jgi:hypothetical protein
MMESRWILNFRVSRNFHPDQEVAKWVRWCSVQDVNHMYFESFSEMVDGLPAKAIFRATEMERRMLEDDVSSKRISLTSGEFSVLDFCHFLEGVRLNADTVPSAMRVEHTAFYRTIVERLVKAGELPPYAIAQFDATFSLSFLKALAT